MKILAADDEKISYNQLVTAIREAAPDAELVAFDDPQLLLEYAEDHFFDVAFLDVEMGEVS